METNKILDADILDLLFEGRNKEYGAYDLRKHYNGRLGRAIAVMACIVLGAFGFGFVGKHSKVKVPIIEVTDPISLAPLPDKPATPPPVLPRLTPPPPQVAMIRVTPPRIVPDDQVDPKDHPPTIDEVETAKIGAVTTAGGEDVGVDNGPVSEGVKEGIVAKPHDELGDNELHMTVEIDATYPGGMIAWLRYLNKNIRYPDEAISREIQGPVLVQFIVDKDGNISDVEAVSGPTDGGLREEAIRVIRKSGKWTPAIQNGRNVKSYKRQPVIFQMPSE